MPQQARIFGQSNMTTYKKFTCSRMFSLSFALCLMAILFMAELQGVTAHRVAAPWDKLVHASVYGFLSGLLWCGLVTRQKFWRLLVLMAILGMAHEWLQLYLPGRTSSVWDWLADVSGSLTVMLYWRWQNERKTTSKAVIRDNLVRGRGGSTCTIRLP
ncbi:VanZ family protein [Methylomicrobium lacus]|uniref:VanZ family protein n=1 Tax=Methylomicrobium lacus TaxID=136992 RepID=UPI0035A97C3D